MSEATVTQTGQTTSGKREGTRVRIVRAAAGLLAAGGRDAVSTRAVSAAAGVQAPTIYRQFGDMRGLLDAVASYGFSTYLHDKTSRERAEDPVEDLRRGWDLHVEFGLANPALYTLMYGDPRPGASPTAALQADEILHGLVQRVAEAGRLRVGVEQAAQMIHAAGRGVTLTLIGTDPEDRDPALSETTREAIFAAVTTEEAAETATGRACGSRAANHAVALKAVLPEAGAGLTSGERAMLSEWLDRIIHRSG
ncbi:MAG: TetR/AcrR family transcriptional regulator [Rubrobacter sp.]